MKAASINGAKLASGQFDLAAVRALDISGAGITSLAKVEAIVAAAAATARPIVQGLEYEANGLGITAFTGITRLDASSNSLTTLDGVELLKSLRYLDVSGNALSSIAALSACAELEELKLGVVTGLDAKATATVLARLPALRALWIEDAPVATAEGTHAATNLTLSPLVSAVLATVPQLELLNGLEVSAWRAVAEAAAATEAAARTASKTTALLASGSSGPASVFTSLPPVARFSESATIAGSASFTSGFVAVKSAIRTADSSIAAATADAGK